MNDAFETQSAEETKPIEIEENQPTSEASEPAVDEENQPTSEVSEPAVDELQLTSENNPSLKKDRGMKKSDWIFIGVCVLLIVGVILFRVWWRNSFYGVVVNGSSMCQTLEHKDELFVRYVKDGEKAERGDVIVVYTGAYEQNGKGKYLIKRLIAVAGDKVRCTDGQVEICYAGTNAYVPLDEPYAYYGTYKLSYDFAEYVVQEGEIFFLGDNRSSNGSSVDSRYKEEASNLKDSLYKETDICGIVPSWSIRHKSICKIFISDQTQAMH